VCVCVSVASVISNSKRMSHIVTCGLFGSTIFFSHYLTKSEIFGKRLQKVNVVFFLNNIV